MEDITRLEHTRTKVVAIPMENPKSAFVFETDWVSKSERSDYEKNIAFLNSFLCEKELIKE